MLCFGFDFRTVEAAQRPLRLAPLPMFSEQVINKQFHPFADYVSNITAQPVSLIFHKSYKTLIEQLLADKVDLAYLGPLPYVLLSEQDSSFIPIVRFYNSDGESTYTCSLAVYSGDNVNLDNDDKIQVSLTQPYSTCGYLFTEYLLNRHNRSLTDSNYLYAGNHAECTLNILRGNSNVSGVKTSIGQRYDHLGVQIIEESDPLPGFLLVANSRTVSAATINRIKKALLDLDPRQDATDAVTTRLWGESIRNGALEVDDEDYDSIRELFSKMVIPGISQ